ncbi:replication associated protein [Microviridae sp.]|nr:replication associated protein [Microviridae sp.]
MKCKSPISVKTVGGLVPCGQCLPCRFNRRREKTFRLMLEFMTAEEGCWVTLTYNDKFLRKVYFDEQNQRYYQDGSGQGLSTLCPDDTRLFIMRLRKRLGSRKIRYFLCGEYGERGFRPHYHVCLFGIGENYRDVIQEAWRDPETKESLGHVCVGSLTQYSLQYTCGYVVKKLTKRDDERLEGLYPEFPRSSIGMGRASIEKIAKALNCKSADYYYLTMDDIPRSFNAFGKSWPMDRYVRSKVLQMLKRFDDATEKGKARFDKEMQRMSVRAQTALAGKSIYPSQDALLRLQYQAENAQLVKNSESRALLFMKAKEKLL